MRPRLLNRRGLSALLSVGVLLGVAACGSSSPQAAPQPSTVIPSVDDQAADGRADLAALAAKAEDRSFTGLYSLDPGNGSLSDVVATVGADGTWRVDVSGAANGGTTSETIVSIAAGIYQCTLSTPTQPVTPTCIRVADPGKKVPSDIDPQVERLFRRWLPVFTDRQSALSVTEVQPLTGVQNSTCFSIDSIQASLQAPVDVGIYCYAADGLLTGARVDYGTLKLVNQAAGPATVELPGPEVQGNPMGTASPPAVATLQPSDLAPSSVPGA